MIKRYDSSIECKSKFADKIIKAMGKRLKNTPEDIANYERIFQMVEFNKIRFELYNENN